MAIFRTVSLEFWTDPKVDDDFTPEDKYFYLYLITNPHTNISGCYEISKKAIERETGYTWDTVSRLLTRMMNVHDVIRYDETTKEVLILNWGKYNWGSSSKVKTAVVSWANKVKNRFFREYILSAVESNDFKALDKPERTEAQPVKETAANNSEAQERGREIFRHGLGDYPELDEVMEYAESKGLKRYIGKAFYYQQDRNEWKDSQGKPIKNWKRYFDVCAENGTFSPVCMNE